MNNALPFLVMREVSSSSRELDIVFHLEKPSLSGSTERLGRLIHAFALAGARGGYPASGFAPHQSRMLLASDITSTPDTTAFHLNTNGVDPRAFQVVRNMAGRLRGEGLVVNRIVVTDTQKRGNVSITVPEPEEHSEADVYPGISQEVIVLVEREQSEFGKVRRCLIEMPESPDARTVLEIAEWTEPWSDILEAGGFSLPVCRPDETDCIAGSVSQFDEITVEIAVDRFVASECAWDVLVNTLDAFGYSSIPLSRIILD